MTGLPSKSLFEQQVALTRIALNLRCGMSQHLSARVLPHLEAGGRTALEDLVGFLDHEFLLDANLGYLLDGAMGKIRKAIAAGTFEEQVAIPRDRLVGCTEAFETRKTLSPDAEALQAALPPIEALYRAVRDAVELAAAIRTAFHMLDLDEE